MKKILLLAAVPALLLPGCVGEERVKKLEEQVAALTKRLDEGKFKSVTIVDAKGKKHAMLGMRDDGTPHLEFVDGGGHNRVLLRLQPDGSPVLVMFGGADNKGDKKGDKKDDTAKKDVRRASAFLAVHGQGPPQMMMLDKTGNQTFKVP